MDEDMMVMQGKIVEASTTPAAEEKRGNPELRAIFVEAYGAIHPFFDSANTWAGQTLDYMAFRVLQERFPTLSGVEIHAIVSAVKRVADKGRAPAP